MTTKIIYQLGDNPVVIITPTATELAEIHQEAKRIVPTDSAYWIVPVLELPPEQIFRNAWRLDVAALGEPSGRGGVCV